MGLNNTKNDYPELLHSDSESCTWKWKVKLVVLQYMFLESMVICSPLLLLIYIYATIIMHGLGSLLSSYLKFWA